MVSTSLLKTFHRVIVLKCFMANQPVQLPCRRWPSGPDNPVYFSLHIIFAGCSHVKNPQAKLKRSQRRTDSSHIRDSHILKGSSPYVKFWLLEPNNLISPGLDCNNLQAKTITLAIFRSNSAFSDCSYFKVLTEHPTLISTLHKF
jgi:hypothetical protein